MFLLKEQHLSWPAKEILRRCQKLIETRRAIELAAAKKIMRVFLTRQKHLIFPLANKNRIKEVKFRKNLLREGLELTRRRKIKELS